MARPRSEDKRQSILSAATRLFAEEGLSAPTARIAKVAGVADGTLFTYFATKDELMNQLYLELKGELRAAMPPSTSRNWTLQDETRQAWFGYVQWGAAHPQKRQVLARLVLSDRVTDVTRKEAAQTFCHLSNIIGAGMSKGPLRDQPQAFVGALMAAMAETTMDFITRDPGQSDQTCEAGFRAFWNAITKE